MFGKRLASKLGEMGHEVLAVDHSEEPVQAVRDEVTKAVVGDVSQGALLEELITENLDAVFVTLATNLEASLLSVLHAQEVGVDSIIAKSSGPEHTAILRRLGLEREEIIVPEVDVAEQLAEKIGNPRVHEYLQAGDGHSIMEMTVPDFFVGKTLRDLNLRDEHTVQVIGVQKGEEETIDYVPSPNEAFQEDDVVWVTGPEKKLKELVGDA